MFYCWSGKCASILETKKNETFESLRRTLDCEYTRCNLDRSYNSVISLRRNAIAKFYDIEFLVKLESNLTI